MRSGLPKRSRANKRLKRDDDSTPSRVRRSPRSPAPDRLTRRRRPGPCPSAHAPPESGASRGPGLSCKQLHEGRVDDPGSQAHVFTVCSHPQMPRRLRQTAPGHIPRISGWRRGWDERAGARLIAQAERCDAGADTMSAPGCRSARCRAGSLVPRATRVSES